MLFRGDALLMEVGLAAVEEGQRIRFAIELRKIELLETGRAITMLVAVARSPGTREGGRPEHSCCRAATYPCKSLMDAERVWMSLAKSAVVDSAMGDNMEAAEGVGEAGVEGVVAAGFGGGAEAEEERRGRGASGSRYQVVRALVLKVSGPRLRS